MSFLWYIFIGLLAGYTAGEIMRGGGYGLIVNIIVGIIGGVVGGWLFSLLGIYSFGLIGNLITSVIGAIVFLWVLSFFTKSPKADS